MKRRHFALGLAIGLLWAATVSWGSESQEQSKIPDLRGRWAIVEVMPAMVQFPILGDAVLTTVAGLLVDIDQQGACLELRGSYCFTDVIMSLAVIESCVPEAFIRALAPVVRTASLRPIDGGWAFEQPSVTEVRAAILADPDADPLPVDAFDPRVIDPDADGHPGLTVSVTVIDLVAGETYVAQRVRTGLSGRLVDADTIRGSISWTSEQNILAASDEFLTMSYAYAPHPDPMRHVFAMHRVGPDWTCEIPRADWLALLDAPTL